VRQSAVFNVVMQSILVSLLVIWSIGGAWLILAGAPRRE